MEANHLQTYSSQCRRRRGNLINIITEGGKGERLFSLGRRISGVTGVETSEASLAGSVSTSRYKEPHLCEQGNMSPVKFTGYMHLLMLFIDLHVKASFDVNCLELH